LASFRFGHVDQRSWNVHTPITITGDSNTSRSVPTKDQVLVPESLLKKLKTQEKTQAERDAAHAEKKVRE
jgi:hypothetical protein